MSKQVKKKGPGRPELPKGEQKKQVRFGMRLKALKKHGGEKAFIKYIQNTYDVD